MKVAILDDEAAVRAALAEGIQDFCGRRHVAAQLSSYATGAALLAEAKTEAFDLAFLDIYLTEEDGLEIAARLREQNESCLIVFCTSSAEHAVASYRVRAFDYLLKPYQPAQLDEVLDLACAALKNQSAYIEVKEGWSMVRILLRDIVYTDYFNHYIHIHTRTRVVKTHLSFAEFSPLLLCYPQFLCCYRNCVINMDAVHSMDTADFVMCNGERVPIARAQRAALRQTYADYAFDKLESGV